MDEIADIRRRAGLTEAVETPEELAQRLKDEQDDVAFDRDRAEEKRIQADLAQKYKSAHVVVEDIWVDLDRQVGTTTTTVTLDDSDVSIAVLAKLSEVGAVALNTMVSQWSTGEHRGMITLTTEVKQTATAKPPYYPGGLPVQR